MTDFDKYEEWTCSVGGQTAQYASGDLLGDSCLEFLDPNDRKAEQVAVKQVTVVDRAAQAANLDLVVLTGSPMDSTFTNNAAADLADNDLVSYVAGVVHLTDHTALNDNGLTFGQADPPIILDLKSSGQAYGVLVSRGTPTYATVTDLLVKLGLERSTD